jgi:D-alanine--poly(phosphoribitol) ligase subunit 2
LDAIEGSIEYRTLKIIAFITNTGEVKQNLDLKLFDVGIMDSLGAVQLIVALSEEFGVDISPSEIEREDIATPGKIIEFMKKRTAK